jgi:hypothetical protein
MKVGGESWVLVAHACNPSYSGDRDQEGSRFEASPWQIVHRDPIWKKKKITKKGWWSG